MSDVAFDESEAERTGDNVSEIPPNSQLHGQRWGDLAEFLDRHDRRRGHSCMGPERCMDCLFRESALYIRELEGCIEGRDGVKKLWCRLFHRRYWYPVDMNSVARVTIYRCGECDLGHAVKWRASA